MSSEEKHGLPPRGRGLSHRARAFLKLAEACLAQTLTRSLRRLRALAVLPVEVPVLRLQQPCPPRRRSTRRASCARSRPRSPRPPRACRAAPCRRIFFGGGTPSLMQPATVGAILDAIGKHWTVAARRRGDARSQSDQRRGDALSRLSRRRRQPRVARRAGARRRGAERARAAAHRAGSARRGRDRAAIVRPLFVRSDLRAAAADAARNGRPNSSAPSPKPPSICRSISSPSSRRRRSPRCMQGRQARHARRGHRRARSTT